MLINGYERRKQGKLLYAKFVHWHLFVLCFAVVCEASSSLNFSAVLFFMLSAGLWLLQNQMIILG